MYLSDAIKYFSQVDQKAPRSRLADALGITVGAVSQWGDVVPEGQAYKLQDITGHKLLVNRTLYRKRGRGPRNTSAGAII